MAKCICTKCKATGHSKNPMTRNVFMDEQYLSLMNMFISYPQDEKGDANSLLVRFIALPVGKTKEARLASFLKELFDDMKTFNVTLEQVLCDHTWVLQEGEVPEC